MIFYPGIHQPSDAKRLPRAFVSVKRLCERRRNAETRQRRKPIDCPDWIMDSGAFTELALHGRYRDGVEAYAEQINRIAGFDPGLRAVVAQDFMCEPFILAKTGLTIADHQRLTIERYDALAPLVRTYVMPVLQGYCAADYLVHIELYGDRLAPAMHVGVGSICKRNGSPIEIEAVLTAIKGKRPDLRLHGFGLKTTALASDLVRRRLYSADSMAWSFAARRQGRNANDWREASAFARAIDQQQIQGWLF